MFFCVAPALAGGFLYYTSAKLFTIVTFIWMSLFILLCMIYYPMYYNSYKYSVNGMLIRVRRGVIYERTDAVYIRNLQYTTLSQTPLQKLMDLATLRLYAAGGVVYMPCLNYEEAKLLRIRLGKKMEAQMENGDNDN